MCFFSKKVLGAVIFKKKQIFKKQRDFLSESSGEFGLFVGLF